MEMDTIYHNSSLNRRRMQGFQPVKTEGFSPCLQWICFSNEIASENTYFLPISYAYHKK